ncbi:V-type ATP synthase subunit I, partial [Candidatus Woesearchaeota archaeon]|nr:V-type ATP synthase subunit I [Candidatus Woesearchaeota archaeon]
MFNPYEMSSVIDTADIGTPLESASKFSEILVKVRALMSALNIKKEEAKFELKKGLLEIEPTVNKLSKEVTLTLEELKKIEEVLSRNRALMQELEILNGINLPLENLTSYKSLEYFTGYIKTSFDVLRDELSRTIKDFMLFSSESKKRNFIILFVDAKLKEKAIQALQKSGFMQFNFTNIANLKGTASENLKKAQEESSKIQVKKEELKNKLQRLAKDYTGFLIASDYFLTEQLEKAEAPLKFASTQSSFLVKGWVPNNDLSKLIVRLNKASKDKVFVHFEPAKKKDNVPVKLKNAKLIKPFEFFLDIYSVPAYKEIDPTFFVFLTFPIFFGIMLGDIGYGLISFAFFWLLKKKMPKAKNLFNILMLASFISMLFGFVFAEFLGFEIYHPYVSREHGAEKLMVITIAIGLIHVNLGLILGFVNELRSHGLMHAIYAKASWILLELGIAMLALAYLKKITISPIIGVVFFVASILMLLKGEGFRGLIEIPTIFTNILSYVRLAAIGLSSVILALIVNEFVKEFFHKGGVFVLIGVLILVTGHIVNILIGWLGSFLHSLRLHYVEFFSKFF